MTSYIKGMLAVAGESEMIAKAGAFGITAKTLRAVIERLPTKGAELLFHTYLKMSEDAASFYGLDRETNLRLFYMPPGVSSIGSKGALAVLSALEPEVLKLAMPTGDARTIAKAPSTDVQTAERIVSELKNQGIVQTLSADTVSGEGVFGAATVEAIGVLVRLGYGIGEATRTVQAVPEAEKKDSETLLREALRQF